jgi:hypothetical protein
MSAYFGTDDRISEAQNLDYAEAATVAFAPGKPIDVKRIVLVIVEAQSAATETLTVVVRDVDDGNSTTIGTFVMPASAAADAVYKVDIANVDTAVTGTDASQPADVTTGRVLGYQTNLPGVIEVNPGQEIAVTSGGTGTTTGQANVYFEYVEMGNNPDRFDATDLTFTHA